MASIFSDRLRLSASKRIQKKLRGLNTQEILDRQSLIQAYAGPCRLSGGNDQEAAVGNIPKTAKARTRVY